MKLLLDTHILIWAAISPEKLPSEVRNLIEDLTNIVYFSAASPWEIAIKYSLNRLDFTLEPMLFANALAENGFTADDLVAQYPGPIRRL